MDIPDCRSARSCCAGTLRHEKLEHGFVEDAAGIEWRRRGPRRPSPLDQIPPLSAGFNQLPVVGQRVRQPGVGRHHAIVVSSSAAFGGPQTARSTRDRPRRQIDKQVSHVAQPVEDAHRPGNKQAIGRDRIDPPDHGGLQFFNGFRVGSQRGHHGVGQTRPKLPMDCPAGVTDADHHLVHRSLLLFRWPFTDQSRRRRQPRPPHGT